MRRSDEETRADIARRRLAELVAAFETDGQSPQPAPTLDRDPAAIARPVPRDRSPRHAAEDVEPERTFRERVTKLDFARPQLRVVLVAIVAMASLTGIWFIAAKPEPLPEGPATGLVAETKPTSADPSANADVVVDVAGKVEEPGIVTLPAGSRVIDAVDAAGGAEPKADTTTLNLARVLIDGEQIVVGITPVAAPDGAPAAGQKVSLNSATTEQLDELPGVGPVTAAATLAAATLAAAAVVAMVSAVKMHSVATNPVAEAAAHGRFVTVSALVASDPRRIGGAMARSSYFRATVKRIDSTDGQFGVRAPVLVFTSEPVDRLTVGSRIVIRGTVRAARSSDLSAEVGARTIAPAADPAWWWTSSRILRDSVADATIRGPPASRALVPALVHGDDQGLSAELVDDFQRSGLTHLLAVSGTNLTIVLGAVLLMGGAAGIRGRGQWLLGLTAVAAFVLLARPEPSVLRAAAMGVVALAALGSRSRGGLRALCWAVIALLIIDPWLGTRAGFGLSVCATAGIIVLAPPWVETLTRWMPRWAAFAVAIPLAAQLACTPLVAAISSEVSLVAVLANMLAAPAVAPATVLGLAGGVVALVSSPAGRLIGLLATLCTHWIALVGHWAAGLPGASAPWTGSLALLVVMCAVAAVVMRQLLRRPPVVAGLCVVLVVVVWRPIDPGWPPRGWFMVTCDVGQGDGSVLNLGEGRAIVVDTGMERRPIERCLDRLRVRHVPLLVFSHSDADHVQGWRGVVEGRRVDRVAVGVSGGPAVPGAARVVMAPGERYRVDDVAVSVLGRRPATSTSAVEPPGESANNASLVLMVRMRGVRILLTGDIEAEAQRALLSAEPDLRADVFKVPHHGSPNQDPRLFAAARARFATVSAGRDNDYGHPSPRTLSLISQHGMTPLRNDRSGDIALVLADGDISAVSQ